uniref:Uncharacterized protein n=1 Tax=uncultured marine virus TaxID=186617 RepID=A0A0F7L4T3_9VIRU|nr:hypothetical protein [uncultured marine virus]
MENKFNALFTSPSDRVPFSPMALIILDIDPFISFSSRAAASFVCAFAPTQRFVPPIILPVKLSVSGKTSSIKVPILSNKLKTL